MPTPSKRPAENGRHWYERRLGRTVLRAYRDAADKRRSEVHRAAQLARLKRIAAAWL